MSLSAIAVSSCEYSVMYVIPVHRIHQSKKSGAHFTTTKSAGKLPRLLRKVRPGYRAISGYRSRNQAFCLFLFSLIHALDMHDEVYNFIIVAIPSVGILQIFYDLQCTGINIGIFTH